MNNEAFMSKLSEEVRQKLAACKTVEEAKKVLAEAGVEPMDDEQLDAVAAGMRSGPYSFGKEGPNSFYPGWGYDDKKQTGQ